MTLERPVRLGVGDEARHRGRRARRRRGGDRRPRRARRPARVDRAAPARARLGAAVRGRDAARAARERGASTRTRGFEVLGRARRRARRDAVRRLLRRASGASRSPARPAAGVDAPLVAAARGRARAARRRRGSRAETLAEARAVQFPGLAGVLPGFGRLEPNDWGLGLELRDAKPPHWTGARNSPRDVRPLRPQRRRSSGSTPRPALALACLTDLDFGDWAKEAWPRLADAVLAEAGAGGPPRRLAGLPALRARARAPRPAATWLPGCGSSVLGELGAGGAGPPRARRPRPARRGEAIEPRQGYWDLPGGFLEEGEEPLDGLRREFREETGLEVEPVEWLGAFVDPYDRYFVLGLTLDRPRRRRAGRRRRRRGARVVRPRRAAGRDGVREPGARARRLGLAGGVA